jgi:MFS family permease
MLTMVRTEVNFRNFVYVRALSSASFIGNPFFILYATDALDLSFGDIANITTYLFMTQTLCTLIWGRLADRLGFRAVYLLGLVLLASATILLLTVSPSLNLIRLVFSLIGAGMGGFIMGSSNLVLEFGTITDRPRRIAIAAIAGDIMRGFAPLIGGVMADTVGYKPVFSIGLSLLLLSGWVMYKLVDEPRFANQ